MFKRKIKDDNIIASKELLKDDFAKWPFKVDKVIIQKRGTVMMNGEINQSLIFITVVINNKLFGLNGSSVDHLKLKSVLDSKYYIKGLDIREFIDIGFDLK